MPLAVMPILKIMTELAATAAGIGSQWRRSKENAGEKDIHSRLKDLETNYTSQVKLVEDMAKEMNEMAMLIQKQIDINNDQKQYIRNLKTSVIILSIFSFACILAIGYLILTKP
ncbi:hypothetical protein JW906_11930 [bacterium]|nr:hypothetical protein [bacterium]